MKKWTMRDGRKIAIVDMGDGHLMNTIRMLQRNGEHKRDVNVAEYLAGPAPTADMASIAFDDEFDTACEATWEDFVPDIYEDLVEEGLRRGFDIPEFEAPIFGPFEVAAMWGPQKGE